MSWGRTGGERTVAIAVLALVFGVVVVTLLVGTGDKVGSLPWRTTPAAAISSLVLGITVVGALGAVRGRALDGDGPAVESPPAWTLVVPAACLLLLVVSPRRFDSIAREDGFIEWLGAVATACACAWSLMAARRRAGVIRAALVAAAIVLFFLTGEELSWLQRLGQYGTPDALAGNGQGEANLHNLATDRAQALYYLVTCATFLLIPFLARWTAIVPERLRSMVPGSAVVVLAASSTAFAFARTGNVAHHVTVWIALGVLVWWSLAPRPVWIFAAGAMVVGGMIMFALIGHELARAWAPDEYREMLIGLAWAVWARQVLVVSRRGAGSSIVGRRRDGSGSMPGQMVE